MRPLEGIRVIEVYDPDGPLALCIAGAFAGRLLADLGAEVLYDDAAPGERAGSDRLRQVPPMAGGGSALFSFLNAGKAAIAASGARRDALLATADAAILDVGAHLLLRAASLPRALALLSLCGEERAGARGSEFTVMALSGVLDIVGDPERQPLKLGGHQAAYSAGLSAFTGLLAALCQTRAHAAARETVRVSMLETMLWINWKSAVASHATGEVPSRRGSAAEWQVVRCADGWVAVIYQPDDWVGLRRLVGDARLEEERFSSAAARLANGRALAAIIEAGLAGQSREEIRRRALAARLPLGPVWSLAELLEDRHYRARSVFVPATMPDGTTAPMVSLPLTWNGARFRPGPIPPLLPPSHA